MQYLINIIDLYRRKFYESYNMLVCNRFYSFAPTALILPYSCIFFTPSKIKFTETFSDFILLMTHILDTNVNR